MACEITAIFILFHRCLCSSINDLMKILVTNECTAHTQHTAQLQAINVFYERNLIVVPNLLEQPFNGNQLDSSQSCKFHKSLEVLNNTSLRYKLESSFNRLWYATCCKRPQANSLALFLPTFHHDNKTNFCSSFRHKFVALKVVERLPSAAACFSYRFIRKGNSIKFIKIQNFCINHRG